MSLLGVVREAIATSGKSYTQLSEESGVPDTSICRFMTGERSLSVETVDKLLPTLLHHEAAHAVAVILGGWTVTVHPEALKDLRPKRGRPRKDRAD